MDTQLQEKVDAKSNAQMLRTLLHAQVLKAYLSDLRHDFQSPLDTHDVSYELTVLEEKIRQSADVEMYPWLSAKVDISLKWPISSLTDLMMRINVEEGQGMYEEVLTMLTKLVNSVLYAQANRKKIYFGKYKAIFELIAEELKADTDKRPGLFLYHKNELFIRSGINADNQTLKP